MNKYKIAIVSACKGYTIDEVRPWAQSLQDSGFLTTGGKVFVILYAPTQELADYFKELDFHVIIANEEGTTHIATQRFADYERLLRTEHFSDIDYVMHTDIRDVIFQRNPLDWFNEAAKENEGHLIYASTEGITFRHEDWNGEGLQHHFGEKLYQELQDVETLCSGVFAAQKGAFADLCKAMYQTAFWSQDPGGFIDQHFYNMLLRKSFDSITRFVPADSPYVANLGTLASIPFNDPKWSTGLRTAGHSYERFRKGTYVENMLVEVPQMIDGKVCTPSGEPYAIVHQYDRYAPWKDAIIKKFNPDQLGSINWQTQIKSGARIVQIGANDGIEGEEYGLKERLSDIKDFSLVLVEPIEKYFNKLKEVYKPWNDKITYVNAAITETDGEFAMVDQGGMSKLSKDGNVKVKGITWDTFTRLHGANQIDLLLLDCEGYEYEILKAIDFEKNPVKCIRYEYYHIPEKAEVDKYLKLNGYEIFYCEKDPTYNKVAIKK